MIKFMVLGLTALLAAGNASAKSDDTASTPTTSQCPDYLNVEMRKLHSSDTVNLCQLTEGKAVVMVNTASNCGFTPQFKALEALHKQYKDDGLVVIGFPSDDFFQEEDDEKDTAKVCFVNYGVTFTMLQTSAVRGSDVNPVFGFLGEQTTSPKWNFYKYVVSRDKKTVQHFNSKVSPEDKEFIQAVEAVL